MAGFQGHITTSTTLGIGLGFAGYWSGQIPDTSCLLAAGLCSFAGMLPDLDSVKSRQHREIIGFLGAVVAAFAIQRLTPHMAVESATAIACLIYLAIRFGVSWLIRVSTYHRGMFHSIPAAILAGELTFLLMTGESSNGGVGNLATLFKTGAVVLGYLSHLVLDEMCSVASNGKIQIKSSLGTAFKWFGKSATANFGIMVLILFLMDPILNRWNFTETTQIASTDQEMRSGAPAVTGTPGTEDWNTTGLQAPSQNASKGRDLSESRRLLSIFSRGDTGSGQANLPTERSLDVAADTGTWETLDTGRELVPPRPMEDGSSAQAALFSAVHGVAGTLSTASADTATVPESGLVAVSPPTQLAPVGAAGSRTTNESVLSSFRSLWSGTTSWPSASSPSTANSPAANSSAQNSASWW